VALEQLHAQAPATDFPWARRAEQAAVLAQAAAAAGRATDSLAAVPTA